MTNVSNITSAYNLVRKRLEQGAYEYPDPDWVQKYNDKNFPPTPGYYTCMPVAAYWWAVCNVAEFYKVEPNSDELNEHIEEVLSLFRAYVTAKAPGTQEPKRFT
jgi:hypothetical protein